MSGVQKGRLAGKVAIVTGAGRAGNIGVAVCEAFLREGAAGVVATDLRDEDAASLVERIEAVHGAGRFRFLRHDVTDAAGWAEVLDQTVSTFGGLDVLVNNAGISIHGGIDTLTQEDLRKVMAINFEAIFLSMKVCAPALADAASRHPGGGAIINNLSMASYMSSANNLAYHASKAAGRMLTMCAAEELGPKRIRVNSVHPGVTITPLIREALADYVARGQWASMEEAEAGMSGMSPLAAVSEPEDVAHAFVYLASDEARFVTGTSLRHDGGIGRNY